MPDILVTSEVDRSLVESIGLSWWLGENVGCVVDHVSHQAALRKARELVAALEAVKHY